MDRILVPDLVAAQAANRPQAVAIERGELRVTYGELLRRADAIAAWLRGRGVGADDRVAVRCAAGIAGVVGAFGVLRAGAVYVPIDPAYPAPRQDFMLADAAVREVIDETADPILDPFRGASPAGGDLAYVVYTSGSTGTPKGVAVEHAALANLVAWHRAAFRPAPGDRICLCAGVGFDAAVWELWPNLAAGATLVIPDDAVRRDPVQLRDFVVSRGITSMFAPTALAQALGTLDWPAGAPLRLLLTGGEALAARPRPGLPYQLVNNYGPTEATVIATSGAVAPGAGRPTIGRPIDGVVVHVLDADLEPVAAGTVGELYLGGAGLARGYLGRPDLTAERFRLDPARGRLYRTGDLVRPRTDGELEYVGRVDDQVQVRGFRVEPAEVEAALCEHPAVDAAAVVDIIDGAGTTGLVGFYVAVEPVGELRAWLAGRVPAHLVPGSLRWRERLPGTANGKVDRAALRAAATGERRDRGPLTPPGTPTEDTLAQAWAAVFDFPVGVDEAFDTLGGHSLHAVRLVVRLREALATEVPLDAFFDRPLTIRRLAAALDARVWPAAWIRPAAPSRGAEAGSLPVARTSGPLPRTEPGRDHPLTAAQRRYWFISQFVPDQALYNVTLTFDLVGTLDETALATRLAGLVATHEVMRTSIVETTAGPRQRVEPVAPVPLESHDLRARPGEADALFAAAAARPFDLTRTPLLRAVLARTGDRDWRLALVTHHIAMDGASIGRLMRDLAADNGSVDGPHATFADVAAWESERLRGPYLDALVAYWRGVLRDAPALTNLPTDHPRPLVGGHTGATLTQAVPPTLLAGVDALAGARGASRFMVMLAALAVVLHRASGQADLVIGAPVANRGRVEFEHLVGCFVNTLPLRCDVAGRPTFAELLARIRRTALDAFAHEELPFDLILEALGSPRPRAHHPLFTVMLVVQPPVPDVDLPGATLRYAGEAHTDKARFDLTVVLEYRCGAPVLSLEYATELFTTATAERLLTSLRRVLDQVVVDDAVPVDRIPLLNAADRAQLLAWGTGPAPLTDIDRPAFRVVEDRCAEHPERPAVIACALDPTSGPDALSYGELNAAANALARALRAAGVDAGAPVGVLLPRSADSVVAMLAVAKAGGAYLPLDPTYPDERLRLALDDARPAVVISRDPARLARLGPQRYVVDPDVPGDDANLDVTVEPDQVAYIIYTSGSTGTPKGVRAHHRGLSNVVAAKVEGFDVRSGSRVLQFVSFGFGVSITDVYMTLTAGATLVVRPDGAVAGRDLVSLVERYRVTNLVLPASVLASLPEVPLPSVRAIAVGGEPCAAALVDQWAPARRFVQAYGPTEAAVASTMAICHAGEGPPPVGRPIPGVRVYVLDRHLEPTPVGATGELYIAGVGVSHGYLGRPELTAAAFQPDAFGPGRMYRTGDLAHWRADGQLVLDGRIDDQVQLRGVRVELGDVEAALRAHPAVLEAVATVREHPVAGQLLVAYLTSSAPPPTAADLRAFLVERLPEHSVPALYVPLAQLPRTGTGKLDRRALPEPTLPEAAASRPPGTVTEEVLADIWTSVLDAAAIGAEDDFFVLGGQSILAASVMAQIRERFEIDLPVRALFDTPTIAALAIRVEQAILADLERQDREDAR